MNSREEVRKAELIEQLRQVLSTRFGERKTRLAQDYIEPYFRRVPMEELASTNPEVLADVVDSQLKFIATRKPGSTLVRVFNPDRRRHGWESDHTVIEMVNDDKPFLVDTATLALSELGFDVHLIIHPVIRVRRGKSGRLTAISDRDDGDAIAESFIQIQINRQTSPEVLQTIEQRLRAAIADVDVAVADWRRMVEVARETRELMPAWAPQADAGFMQECQDFMSWLIDDQFIFLGVRDYEVVRGKKGHDLRIVSGSGLGILRESGDSVRARPLTSLAEEARKSSSETPLIITKTNARSTVHRVGYLDYIGVLRFDKRGRTVAERRFLGLFTSSAYSLSVMNTPLIRGRARQVLDSLGLHPGSHAWKTMMHILETLPRDDLFQAEAGELAEIAEGVLNLQERRRVRLFIRRERYGRFYSCLVYIPRERFNTENRERIQAILKRALKGRKLDFVVNISESMLARLHVIIRPHPGAELKPDVALLEQKIVDAVRSWNDELTAILVQKHGEEDGLELASRFEGAFPEAYKEDVSPWVAGFDVDNADAVSDGEDLRMSLYRPRRQRSGIVRLKLFRRDDPIPLSEVLPMLENLGLRIVSERPYELRMADDQRLWIQDFDMIPAVERDLNLEIIRDRFQEAFEKTLYGQTESDRFNHLVIAAQMNWRQAKVLRAYCKYLLQVGSPFSQNYMAETLAKFPAIARLLIELFEARFDPERPGETEFRREQAARNLSRTFEALLSESQRKDEVLGEYIGDLVAARAGADVDHQAATIRTAFQRALASVSSLDEDRILHAFYNMMRATLRTSYFRSDDSGAMREYISFKIDSARVADMPLPRPYREIWVYSPQFEGIHLRGGQIARGGLRWSDRREDFRTEVLGLMKAQNVKNTMIVPVGAKGGFVLKRPPPQGDREALMQEGIRCYKQFINALLDITDNLDEQEIIHPEAVVRHDDDDSYLVVAADKGTATFSDIANGISLERDFWLADAFASGGSVGYDHKGMGITAKGAWEGVKRHFRELGVDIQRQPFTVVGIGDMSGDVFGNGMLLSRKIRLQAAFDHRHVFLDPDPDPKTSWAERRRLFRKPRSSWDDYDRKLISKGGGVFSRSDKMIPLSPEVREWLQTDETQLAPHLLIRLLLKAPVDLLWNGGIGTYVKASTESHADVGDLSNNGLRVNGNELRCRVVGEGGNLGLTQRGRIEFARAGGRVNTDFIDNSAGVDTSDHEVNIKILLAQAIRAGKLKESERPKLLASMTKEVESLVLRSNYLQTQTLSMMESLRGPRMGAKQHFISVMEDRGVINRQLEFLPDDDDLTERRNRGEGLLRPELAVLLSYAKIVVYQQLLSSDLPEDDYLSRELVRYFPEPLRERFSDVMQDHRLRREIIATQVTNSMVNRMGVSFTLRMEEDTGASAAAVAKAFTIAREIFEGRAFWSSVEALDNKVDAGLQNRALLAMWNLLRQATRWILIRRGLELDVKQDVERLAPGLAVLSESMRDMLSETDVARITIEERLFMEGGFPAALARRVAILEHLFPALDVADTAAQRRMNVKSVARVYFGLGESLRIKWLREQLESLPVKGQWHAQARALLRDELFSQQNRLVERVLRESGKRKDPTAHWMQENDQAAGQLINVVSDMANLPAMDYATVSVAIRALGQLVAGTASGKGG
ncbi:NAD-glutamate dehydrogenase [Elongatibacter sediminis]|uniref:NAD-glutamate dehydrogenase n=1 Tax=Elongatibacter sediminis TaxID=3119006 RepID=A0AAW9RDZ1_9GAMM